MNKTQGIQKRSNGISVTNTCPFKQKSSDGFLNLKLYAFKIYFTAIGPLQDTFTWYKIRHTGTQTAHWLMQNKEDLSLSDLSRFVLDVPVRSLCSSMADFVPCERILQRAYCIVACRVGSDVHRLHKKIQNMETK